MLTSSRQYRRDSLAALDAGYKTPVRRPRVEGRLPTRCWQVRAFSVVDGRQLRGRVGDVDLVRHGAVYQNLEAGGSRAYGQIMGEGAPRGPYDPRLKALVEDSLAALERRKLKPHQGRRYKGWCSVCKHSGHRKKACPEATRKPPLRAPAQEQPPPPRVYWPAPILPTAGRAGPQSAAPRHFYGAPVNGTPGHVRCGATGESLLVTGKLSAVTCPDCRHAWVKCGRCGDYGHKAGYCHLSGDAGVRRLREHHAEQAAKRLAILGQPLELRLVVAENNGPEEEPIAAEAPPREHVAWDHLDAEQDLTDLTEPDVAPAPPIKREPIVRRCSICKETGHYAKTHGRPAPEAPVAPLGGSCPECAAGTHDRRSCSGRVMRFGQLQKCGYCKEPGHKRTSCPRKEAGEPAVVLPPREPRTRGKTESPMQIKRAVRHYLKIIQNDNALDDADLPPRPRTRGDCEGTARPCPYVGCHYHLYLDVNEATGAIKFNFPHLEPEQMGESCALDVADRDGVTLEEVGVATNLTRERIRQIETMGLEAIREATESSTLHNPTERLASPLAGAQTL